MNTNVYHYGYLSRLPFAWTAALVDSDQSSSALEDRPLPGHSGCLQGSYPSGCGEPEVLTWSVLLSLLRIVLKIYFQFFLDIVVFWKTTDMIETNYRFHAFYRLTSWFVNGDIMDVNVQFSDIWIKFAISFRLPFWRNVATVDCMCDE